MSNQARCPAGASTGGQFAANQRPEGDVSLATAPAATAPANPARRTPEPVKPANAGAVTRTLVAAGFRKGEEHKAARGVVRGGWSTFTEGITSTQDMKFGRRRVRQGTYRDGSPRYTWQMNNTPTGRVHVEYQFRSHDQRSLDEQAEKAIEVLTRAADVLRTRGFQTEMGTRGGTSQIPRLTVWREDADGEIVRW